MTTKNKKPKNLFKKPKPVRRVGPRKTPPGVVEVAAVLEMPELAKALTEELPKPIINNVEKLPNGQAKVVHENFWTRNNLDDNEVLLINTSYNDLDSVSQPRKVSELKETLKKETPLEQLQSNSTASNVVELLVILDSAITKANAAKLDAERQLLLLNRLRNEAYSQFHLGELELCSEKQLSEILGDELRNAKTQAASLKDELERIFR
jgi:hypothetical protein